MQIELVEKDYSKSPLSSYFVLEFVAGLSLSGSNRRIFWNAPHSLLLVTIFQVQSHQNGIIEL